MRERLISPQDIARAAKTFVYVQHLSPSARRLGLALLDHLNVYNARCDPSEARLAAMLHLSERAIRNAKNELRRVGFITWRSHGGLMITADYRMNFTALHAACDRIETNAKTIFTKRHRGSDRKTRSNGADIIQTGSSIPKTGNSLPATQEAYFLQTNPLNSPIELSKGSEE